MKESHKHQTTKALAVVFFALLLSWANSEDDIIQNLKWHLEGASYGALIIFGESRTVSVWEICGTKTEKEILDLIDINGPKFDAEEALIIFVYEKNLKQISYGISKEKFTSRILHRSSNISGDQIFPEFEGKTIEEMTRVFETLYSAKRRLIAP